MSREKQDSLIKYKLLFTAIILLIYLVGKEIPLYMVDVSVYLQKGVETEDLILQTISGDIYRCSIFALGISPFMISSLFVQIISSFMGADAKARISPSKMNKLSLIFTLILAALQATMQVQDLHFTASGDSLILVWIVAEVEMVAGAMVIMWLCNKNKRYGIGGQSALVLVNVIDSIKVIFEDSGLGELVLPLVISALVMIVTVIMENTEKRIPVQRISIHNIYADKNYLAIKLNPIGVTPAMFSTAFFMVPQLVISMAAMFWPSNRYVLWFQENMSLNKSFGIVVYIVILYVLSIGLSRVFLNPKEITEQYLKSGDSLQDVHAGVETKKYLSRTINSISLLSATSMAVCLAIPMILQLNGHLDSGFVSLPSMVMMLTGVWCNLYREYRAIRDLEAYKPFI